MTMLDNDNDNDNLPPVEPPTDVNPPEPAPEPGGNKRRTIIGFVAIGLVVAGLVTFGLVKGGVFEPDTITVSGSIDIMADLDPSEYSTPHFVKSGVDGCAGAGGYSDLREGASVTVYGKAGQTIALGSINGSYNFEDSMCVLDYSIPDVPAGEGFYAVEVTHRGKLTGSESEVSDHGILVISGTIGN